jgi:hypothetical protein
MYIQSLLHLLFLQSAIRTLLPFRRMKPLLSLLSLFSSQAVRRPQVFQMLQALRQMIQLEMILARL